MASEELIDQYIDRTGVGEDTTFMLSQLNQVLEAFNKIKNTKITLEGDKSFKQAAESIKQLRTEEEQLVKIQGQVETARKRRMALESEAAKELAKEKELIRQRNQELKNQVREEAAAEGSIEKMRAALIRLRKEYDNLNDADRNSEMGEGLKNQIAGIDSELKKLEGQTGRFQRNVGNYASAFAGAFQVLKGELIDVQNKINSGNFSGTALQELQKQEQLLIQVTAGLGQQFSSTRQESRAFQEAAQKLGISLGQDSQAFQAFRKEVGAGVDSIQDVKDSIKLAASDTKGLDNLIGAAQGMVGAFSVAQGAAALFAGENEELEKTFVKLQAAMTVLNGLQAIQQELTRKDSIFRKIALGAQALWIKATQGATATVQAEAAAHAENAAAIEAENAARMAGAASGGATSAVQAIQTEIELVENLTDAQDTLQDATKATTVITEIGTVANEGAAVAQGTNAVATEGATVAENANQTAKKRGVAATMLHTVWTNISAAAQRVWAATALKSAAATIALRAAMTGGLILLLPAVAYAFAKIADASEKASKKAEELRAAQKALSEVNVKAAASVAEVRVQINEMKTKFELARKGVLDKKEVLKEYNEGLGKTIGATNDLATAEQNLIDKAPALIQFTFLKAQAEAAAELAKKAATENIEAQGKQMDEFVSGWDKTKAVITSIFSFGANGAKGVADASTKILKGAKDEQNEVIDETQKSGERFLKMQQDFLKKAADFAAANGLNFNPKDPKKPKKESDNSAVKNAEEERKALHEIEQQRIRDKMANAAAVAESDQNSFNSRLDAEAAYYEFSKQLLDGQKVFELKELDERAKREKLTAEQKNAQRLLIEQKYNSDILALNADSEKRISALVKENTEKRKQLKDKAVQDTIDSIQDELTDQLEVIQANADEELKVELEKYKRGEINKEQYETNKVAIENKARRLSLLAEIEYQKKLLSISNLPEDKRKEALEKLYDLEAKLRAMNLSDEESAAAKSLAIQEKRKEKLKELANELKGLTFDLFTGAIDREKQELEDQILLLDEKKAKEIETVNQTIKNAEEREKAIVAIEARANAERVQMERKKRALDLERARFERARNIADIIQSTAVAVVSALGSKPWTPANIALAAIVGAIGAAQVARVIAQPLPKFKEGKGEYNDYEGLAVVGDGGRKEAIIREDGSIEVTPNRDTIAWVGKNDIIHPDADKFFTQLQMQMANKKVGAMVAGYQGKGSGVDLTPLQGTLNRGFNQLNRSIKNMPQTNIQVEGVGRKWIKSNGSYTEFI